MVDELHNDLPSLLIPAPIGRDRMKGLSWSLDYTGDRIYVLNPSHSKPQTLQQLQFFGVFLGVAIRFFISNSYLPLISAASDPSQRTLHCAALILIASKGIGFRDLLMHTCTLDSVRWLSSCLQDWSAHQTTPVELHLEAARGGVDRPRRAQGSR
jgi:hypothetical protein